ncbi:MAG: YbdD/YjiX family protein [Acidobacteriia bacterium]|nr:YbdD/YjiX family protein [Terriglobia bacterium]
MQRNPSSHFVFRVSIVAISRLAGAAWQSLREWSGDAAYDRYLLIAGTRPGAAPLSRSDFYVEHLQRRYSRPSRCC